MEREEMKRFSMAALRYTLSGEPEKAATIVKALASTGDPRDLYGACCGWAGSAEVALERIHDAAGGDIWSFAAAHAGDLTGSPEETFALRFIAAYGNGDRAITEALFMAMLKANGAQIVGSVGLLLRMAADLNAEALA